MTHPSLFVSFWHLCLGNLPLGSFTHRCLSPEQAKDAIEQARLENMLFCVSNEDLLAPYKQHALQKHRELCTFLEQQHSIPLAFGDFLLQDESDALVSIRPLQMAAVQGQTRLMVITCAYTVSPEKDLNDPDSFFRIAPDSAEFHLLEAGTGA